MNTTGSASGAIHARRLPGTLFLGLAIILVCEGLLAVDVHRAGRGAIHSQQDAIAAMVREPHDWWAALTGSVAINMTPLAWLGYVVFLEGLLAAQRGVGPARSRPNHFALCALASVIVWCGYDLINFYCFQPTAWNYISPPLSWPQRYLGYLVAFAAELPAMFMTGQVLINLRWFSRLRGRPFPVPRWVGPVSVVVGAAMLCWPIFSGSSAANCTLWPALVFLLDPINLKLGRPSVLGDWRNGWYGRIAALFSTGLLCGFLWEFWNYWALAKWTYHLPFLGRLEHYRYFEMPLAGLIGFIPFGMACWVMWQTLRIPLDGLAENLPSDRELI